MSDKERIKKLEDEVVELRKQLLDVALRQPAVIMVPFNPVVAPTQTPYYPDPVYPHNHPFNPPSITWGNSTDSPNFQSFQNF